MAEHTVLGIDAVLVYSILNFVWLVVIAFSFRQYLRRKRSKSEFYIWTGIGVLWLVYGSFNLSQQLLPIGTLRIWITVLLSGLFLAAIGLALYGVNSAILNS